MTGKHVSQAEQKGASAAAASAPVGTEHALTAKSPTAEDQRIVAGGTAMTVQCAGAAAVRTGRLLEGKSMAFNALASGRK